MGLAGRSANSESGPLRVALIIWIVVAVTAALLRGYGANQRFGSKLAVTTLLMLAGYWGALSVMHRLAAANANSIAKHIAAVRGEHVLRAVAMPTAASAFRWQSVAETDQAMYRFMVRAGNASSADSADGTVTRFAKPNGGEAALVKIGIQDRRAQTLIDFAVSLWPRSRQTTASGKRWAVCRFASH